MALDSERNISVVTPPTIVQAALRDSISASRTFQVRQVPRTTRRRTKLQSWPE
jgi:hypothetical protein